MVAAPLPAVEEADLPTPAVAEGSVPLAAAADQVVHGNVDWGVAFYIILFVFSRSIRIIF